MTLSVADEGFALNGSYELAYEVYGSESDPMVLLVNGLGSQMLGFRVGFCERFVNAGFRVIRYDNRDVGLSTKTSGGAPSARVGGSDMAAYSIEDMAADGMAVLDAVGVTRAHVWGMSMGGMIAQTMAIVFPERVLSLTSVMSTTGDRSVGLADPEAAKMLTAGRPADLDEAIAMDVREREMIAGAHFDEAEITSYVAAQYERCRHPEGQAHQYAAIVADGDRTDRLRDLDLATTVIHGAMDVLIDKSGGEATAGAIAGAKLVVVDSMGHDIPEPLWDLYAAELVEVAGRI